MAASNKQPAGGRPGPKAAHVHAPHTKGKTGSQSQTPAPRGPGDKRPIKTTPTGPNANKLH